MSQTPPPNDPPGSDPPVSPQPPEGQAPLGEPMSLESSAASESSPLQAAEPMVEPDPTDEAERRGPLGWLKSELAIATGRRRDRWRHRRGEPRLLAFLWTMYLLVATGLALGSVAAGGIVSLETYIPVARALAVVVAAGLVIGWPLVRLSQISPAAQEQSVPWAMLKDVALLLIPVQAVFFPQVHLANWDPSVPQSLAMALGGWLLVIGAVLAYALGTDTTLRVRLGLTWTEDAHAALVRKVHAREARRRSMAMTACIVLTLAGPVAAVVVGSLAPDRNGSNPSVGSPRPGVLLLASPLGFAADVTADRGWSGRSAAAMGTHFQIAWWTLGVGAALWLVPGIAWGHGRSKGG